MLATVDPNNGALPSLEANVTCCLMPPAKATAAASNAVADPSTITQVPRAAFVLLRALALAQACQD